MSGKTIDFQINLVPTDPFFKTSVGRFLNWAVHIGRYIVIFTELVVIISFATRFTLDRRITDLNDSIHQKKSIVQSYGTLERDFRLIQAKIENYQQVEQTNNLVEVFPKIKSIIPSGVSMNELNIERDQIWMTAQVRSQAALNTLISNMHLSPYFDQVDSGQIESVDSKKPGYQVQITSKVLTQTKD
ncbi:MAG: hypothetical protein GF381_02815 [Candidatus Pacebacteria bacterium]|nr:hypothetical protein [Candidatus Paceibacterota bacterium]